MDVRAEYGNVCVVVARLGRGSCKTEATREHPHHSYLGTSYYAQLLGGFARLLGSQYLLQVSKNDNEKLHHKRN